MRSDSKVARSVLAVSIVVALAIPAHAKPQDSGRLFDKTIEPIVKSVKKLVLRALGDGLGDPWPKP